MDKNKSLCDLWILKETYKEKGGYIVKANIHNKIIYRKNP